MQNFSFSQLYFEFNLLELLLIRYVSFNIVQTNEAIACLELDI
jgi:hypothetical protein